MLIAVHAAASTRTASVPGPVAGPGVPTEQRGQLPVPRDDLKQIEPDRTAARMQFRKPAHAHVGTCTAPLHVLTCLMHCRGAPYVMQEREGLTLLSGAE